MVSTGATGLDVITTGFTGAGRDSKLIRTVSFFGPRFADDDATIALSPREAGETGGVKAGRRGKILGASAVDSAEGGGTILGGTRRIDVTEGLEGRTTLGVSWFAALGSAAACSDRDGSAMRTVSFFGSAMGGWGLRWENRTNRGRMSLEKTEHGHLACAADRRLACPV
jgi:hypothetical protein